jgi:hypothetical protein
MPPDLQAFPASDIAIEPDGDGGVQIIFSTLTWNSGLGQLHLVAREIGGSPGSEVRNVSQFLYNDDGSNTEHHAGTFDYHPEHAHFHFGNYALYSLQSVDAPGQSDRTSSKTTFCIMDTDRIDRRLPGAPKRPVYRFCSNDVQGMSVGYGDEYGSHLAGQEIDVTALPAGDYRLVIEADPNDKLIEINDDNNSSCVLLHIDAASQSLTVLNANDCGTSGGGEEELVVSTIDPDIVERGSVNPVVITGSGFQTGMGVSFENGSGPRPTAADVEVNEVDDTITAFVTVKNNGRPGDSTWDVRVGPAVLPDGLFVSDKP